MELMEWIQRVSLPDEAAMDAARERQAQLAKPPGSLGRLEDLSIQLAGITGKVHNSVKRQHLLVFAADNGVVEEGVSSAPQSVTLSQTINLTRAKTGASTLCKHFGCEITVCDVGVNANIKEKKVLNRKIAYGTSNIVKGPAMTKEQAIQAILTGIELAANTQADVIGIGEMGIGNTTTSSAVLSVLLEESVEAVTGRGGGITDAGFIKKKQVIKDAIAINQPNKNKVVDVLAKVGGFDIAAMCGAFIGCAATRKPVVIDGFISAVAALCAYKLCPNSVHYFIPSHASYEIGYKLAMDAMGLEPLFLLGMLPVPLSTIWQLLSRQVLTTATWMRSGRAINSLWRERYEVLHFRWCQKRKILSGSEFDSGLGEWWKTILYCHHDFLRKRGR